MNGTMTYTLSISHNRDTFIWNYSPDWFDPDLSFLRISCTEGLPENELTQCQKLYNVADKAGYLLNLIHRRDSVIKSIQQTSLLYRPSCFQKSVMEFWTNKICVSGERRECDITPGV